ncbi:MAG: hypothetical protein OXU36_06085 [Candidatus Poribacteria bacterium]|nr:hypothetical protein [Candidatus Poribacteria bacterium]
MTNERLLESLTDSVKESIKEVLSPVVEQFATLDNRLMTLENRVDLIEKLISIFAIDRVKEQIEKDNLYPHFSDEDRVITAIDRITEKQNGLGKMIIEHLGKHELS